MGVKSELFEVVFKSAKQRRADKVLANASAEQQAKATRETKVKVMTDEMDINPSLARQAADGEISVAEAQIRSANQNRRLGTGKEQEVMDDNAVISAVNGADPDGIKRFEVKRRLSPEQKAALTDAEIAYKKGNPKPLADVYKAILPIAGIGGSTAALANPEVKSSGYISAPRSGMLHNLTMGMRDVGRRLQGSPAQLANPENLTQYLETVNSRVEDPNARTRMFAALDVAPF